MEKGRQGDTNAQGLKTGNCYLPADYETLGRKATEERQDENGRAITEGHVLRPDPPRRNGSMEQSRGGGQKKVKKNPPKGDEKPKQ